MPKFKALYRRRIPLMLRFTCNIYMLSREDFKLLKDILKAREYFQRASCIKNSEEGHGGIYSFQALMKSLYGSALCTKVDAKDAKDGAQALLHAIFVFIRIPLIAKCFYLNVLPIYFTKLKKDMGLATFMPYFMLCLSLEELFATNLKVFTGCINVINNIRNSCI